MQAKEVSQKYDFNKSYTFFQALLSHIILEPKISWH
jgi:hypothetical protein